MRRREFITLIGGAAAWPLAATAQHDVVPVVGVLGSGSPSGLWMELFAAFQQGLTDGGYIEGRNVTIEASRRSSWQRQPSRGARHGGKMIFGLHFTKYQRRRALEFPNSPQLSTTAASTPIFLRRSACTFSTTIKDWTVVAPLKLRRPQRPTCHAFKSKTGSG